MGEAISWSSLNEIALAHDPITVVMIEASVERNGARTVSTSGEGTDGPFPIFGQF